MARNGYFKRSGHVAACGASDASDDLDWSVRRPRRKWKKMATALSALGALYMDVGRPWEKVSTLRT